MRISYRDSFFEYYANLKFEIYTSITKVYVVIKTSKYIVANDLSYFLTLKARRKRKLAAYLNLFLVEIYLHSVEIKY